MNPYHLKKFGMMPLLWGRRRRILAFKICNFIFYVDYARIEIRIVCYVLGRKGWYTTIVESCPLDPNTLSTNEFCDFVHMKLLKYHTFLKVSS